MGKLIELSDFRLQHSPASEIDRQVVSSAIEGGQCEGATTVEQLTGLVAERIHASSVERGGQLIMPLVAMVMRVARRGFTDVAFESKLATRGFKSGILDRKIIEDTLVFMQEAEVDGLVQGDVAMHNAAHVGGSHLGRAFDARGRLDYCEMMARAGYGRVMAHLPSRAPLRSQLEVLLDRFTDSTIVIGQLLH